MPYELILAPEAVEDLQRLRANDRATVRAALTTHLLDESMRVNKSRIKRLRGVRRPQYRLRIDDLRVFYDVQAMYVEIIAILDKSDVDAWLAQFGEAEEGVYDEADSPLGSEE